MPTTTKKQEAEARKKQEAESRKGAPDGAPFSGGGMAAGAASPQADFFSPACAPAGVSPLSALPSDFAFEGRFSASTSLSSRGWGREGSDLSSSSTLWRRSEERRVGKECRSRVGQCHE